MCEGDCALRRTMESGTPFVDSRTYIVTRERKKVPISVSTSVLKDSQGEILGGVETFRDSSLVEELRRELEAKSQFGDMVSKSRSMQQIFSMLEQIAASDSTVLIQGETGTGKELLGRAIHNLSSRKDKPFLSVNCGAFPDSLLESELFGYMPGAFTGADSKKQGLFQAAEGGTLLLDEIGDTSSAFQVRLLRILEEKEVQPLGSTKPIKIDVRILAATHRDLRKMVAEGSFRQDLFYRINVMPLTLPSLRERSEDIPLLVDRFIEKMNRIRGAKIAGIEPVAMGLLLAHDYPGNIRELENIIEHAFVLCTKDRISPHHLPAYLSDKPKAVPSISAPDSGSDILADTEKGLILNALQECNFNRLATARLLGIHKSTLFRKIKKLQIDLPDRDGRSSL